MISNPSDMLEVVERFNREVIDLPIPDVPTRLSEERKRWAVEAFDEEICEFVQAEILEDEADAMVDLAYFALGRLIEMGICPGPAFEEVHRANMQKRRGFKAARPHSLGHDAVKPKGWRPPDLGPMLTISRHEVVSQVENRDAFEQDDRS